MHLRFISALTAFFVSVAIAVPDDIKIEIGITNATLNGTNLFTLSVDAVTDLFGRPSFVFAPKTADNPRTVAQGTQLWYLNNGLKFVFAHPDENPKQPCKELQVFLSRCQADETGGEWQACTARLTKRLDGNWKVKRVLKEFSDCKPVDAMEIVMQDPKAKKDFEDTLKMVALAERTGGDVKRAQATRRMLAESYKVFLEIPTHLVVFHYEPTTGFIENIIVSAKH